MSKSVHNEIRTVRRDTACIRCSPDPLPSLAEVGRACETRLAARGPPRRASAYEDPVKYSVNSALNV